MKEQVSNNVARRAWNYLRKMGYPLFGQAADGRSGIVRYLGQGEVQFDTERYPVRSLPLHVRQILRNSRDRFFQYWG